MAIQISGTPVIDNSRNLVNANRIYTTFTSEQATSKAVTNREFCNVTASNVTITLPAVTESSVGWEVVVGISTSSTNTTVTRNSVSDKIMGLAEDITIDYGNVAVTFVYTGSNYGWRIV